MAKLLLKTGEEIEVDEDLLRLLQLFNWYKTKNGYISGNILLHRLVLEAPRHLVVDHINRNKLDNRKSNLRLATQSQNQMNIAKRGRTKTEKPQSKYKGVSRSTYNPAKWTATIKINKKNTYLGTFKTEEEAACAYNQAALQEYSQYALLNSIEGT